MRDTATPSSSPLSLVALSRRAGEALERLRARAPRIHALTSAVAQNLTANGLLALGAAPSLTAHPDEIDAFVGKADALLLNLGTPDPDRVAALRQAAESARRQACPVVLDPVFVEDSPLRLALVREFAPGAALVKLNRREADALASVLPAALPRLVTGERDHVVLGSRTVALAGGHALAARVTATGCLLGAIAAAFLAVERDPLVAALAASGLLKHAGTEAGRRAAGPGSFVPLLIDALAAADGETLARALVLSEGDAG